MKQRLNFVYVVGRPTAGTTTHGRFLTTLVNRNDGKAAFISPGDLCRDAKETPTHRYHTLIKGSGNAVTDGGLVPDEVISQMLMTEVALHQQKGVNTFIFSGYPRTIPQVAQIGIMRADLAKNHQVGMDFVHLEVDEDEVRRRVTQRREENRAAGKPQREDDTLDTIERRLTAFRENTAPAIELLESSGMLISVSTQNRTIAAVDLQLGLLLSETLLGRFDGEPTRDYSPARRR